MKGLAQKIRDRFKPSLMERLKQSAEAKKLKRNAVPLKPVVVDIETRPQRFLESETMGIDTRGTINKIQIWREWSTNSVTSCNTCDTWNVWHQNTATYATTQIWGAWSTNQVILRQSGATTGMWESWQDQPQPRRYQAPVETPEQRRRRDEQEAQYQRERVAANARYLEDERVRLRKKEEADERALKLLVSMLNEQQKADLKRDKHFFVEAPSGRLYRIDYGTHGNVKVVDRLSRKIVERLCIQPNGVPAGDANLMQKLMIETAEELFRSYANITLEDGRMVYGKSGSLDNVELAKVIPIRKAA